MKVRLLYEKNSNVFCYLYIMRFNQYNEIDLIPIISYNFTDNKISFATGNGFERDLFDGLANHYQVDANVLRDYIIINGNWKLGKDKIFELDLEI